MSLDVVSSDLNAVGASRGRKSPAGSNSLYRWCIGIVAAVVAAIFVQYVYSIVQPTVIAWPIVGWHFFVGTNWNYGAHTYGALPLIVGTIVVAALAILVAAPIGIGTALALVFLVPRRFRFALASAVELLAFVPSIIYGVWGYLVIAPWLDHTAQPWLYKTFHHKFPFSQPGYGDGLLLGVIVLAVMILPTVAAISRDVLTAVPHELVEGGLSVGATKSQVLRKVVLPSARPGLIGAVTLGIGRALGETIAMVLLLGNVARFPVGFNSTLATLATEFVNNFGNTTSKKGFGILCCLAVVLCAIVGTTNFVARTIVRRNAVRLAL